MTRATVVHDPVEGDQIEVFLRASDVWTVLDHHLASQPTAQVLDDVAAVHRCLDPLGMPELNGHPCWSVPPDAMWRLTVGVTAPASHRWLAEAVHRVDGVLRDEFPELVHAGQVAPDLHRQRQTWIVQNQLASASRHSEGCS